MSPTEIARQLHLSVPTVLYHLRLLRTNDRVAWLRWGNEIHCFPSDVAPSLRQTITVMSREPARRVALNILHEPFLSLRERAEEIGISRQALHQQIGRMREAGLLVPVQDEHGRPGWMLGDSLRASLGTFLAGTGVVGEQVVRAAPSGEE